VRVGFAGRVSRLCSGLWSTSIVFQLELQHSTLEISKVNTSLGLGHGAQLACEAGILKHAADKMKAGCNEPDTLRV
jgi:hypothetical protein